MSFLLTGNNLLYDHISWVVHFLHIPRFHQIRFFLSFLFIKLSRYSLSNVRIIIPSLLYRLLNFRFNTSLKASESTRNQGKTRCAPRGTRTGQCPAGIVKNLISNVLKKIEKAGHGPVPTTTFQVSSLQGLPMS